MNNFTDKLEKKLNYIKTEVESYSCLFFDDASREIYIGLIPTILEKAKNTIILQDKETRKEGRK